MKSKAGTSLSEVWVAIVKRLSVGDTFGAGRLLPKHQQDDEKNHGSCHWMVSLDLRMISGKAVGGRSKLLGLKIATQIRQIDRTISVIIELCTYDAKRVAG